MQQALNKPAIVPDMLIEDLVDNYPFAVKYLMQNGIRCIMCGEPIWGTLEEAALEKGFSKDDIDRFIEELVILDREQVK